LVSENANDPIYPSANARRAPPRLAAAPFLLTPPAGEAAAPPVGKQAPGFYRHKVGSIEVTVVVDGINRVAVSDASFQRQEGRSQRGARRRLHGEGRIRRPYNPIVVNTGAKLAVIDTGTGEPPPEPARASMVSF